MSNSLWAHGLWSLPGIFQARVLEWVAISFSRGSSQPMYWIWVSCFAGRCFTLFLPWKESYDKPRQHIKKQSHHFPNKGLYTKIHGFSHSHVQMWELDHKKVEHQKVDAFKLWCWRRLLRAIWTVRTSKQSILKEVIGRTNAEAEAPIIWPPDVKSWLIGGDPDAEKV